MILYLQLIPDEADQSKFEQVYLMYRGLMFQVARQILKNSADAEDAVHQSFLKLIGVLDRVGEPNAPQTKSLLAIITERTAIDLLRQRRRENTISFELFPEWEDDFRLEEEIPTQLDLASAIAALPARYREVLLLKYDCGYSDAETAELCGMTEANVKKTVQRAKAKLKSALEKGEGQP